MKAKKELEDKGYLVARAMASSRKIGNIYITKYNDFFHVFDLIAVKDNEVRLIQVTSGSGLSSHKKKILDNFPYVFDSVVSVEIWYYYKMGRVWKYKILYLKRGEWLESKL